MNQWTESHEGYEPLIDIRDTLRFRQSLLEQLLEHFIAKAPEAVALEALAAVAPMINKLEALLPDSEVPIWPEPTIDLPPLDILMKWTMAPGCLATDGCEVDFTETCPHGHPAWFIRLGLSDTETSLALRTIEEDVDDIPF